VKTIKISAAFEKKLRKSAHEAHHELFSELVALLDAYKPKKVLDAERQASKPEGRLGYRDLVAHAADILGQRLLLPPKPSEAYTNGLAAGIRALGIDIEQWRRICERASFTLRGPIELATLRWQALKLLYGAEPGLHDAGAANQGKAGGAKPAPSVGGLSAHRSHRELKP
jgi:hypothetical protein